MTAGELRLVAKAIVDMVLDTTEKATRKPIVFPAGYVTRDGAYYVIDNSPVIIPVPDAMTVAVQVELHKVYMAGVEAGRATHADRSTD